MEDMELSRAESRFTTEARRARSSFSIQIGSVISVVDLYFSLASTQEHIHHRDTEA